MTRSTLRRLLFLAMFLASNAVYAGCLSNYNADLYACEGQYTFERIGCKMDAVVDYWSCVGSAMTN